MTDDTSKLFDRIRKILAKAEGTDNPEEAQTFFDKAVAMMAEHEISKADLGDYSQGPAPIEHQVLTADALWKDLPYSNARSRMFTRIARVMGATAYFVPSHSGRKTMAMGIVGTAAAIDRTVAIFHLAQAQADRVVLRANPPEWENVRTYRRSMFEGFTSTFVTRLYLALHRTEEDPNGKGGLVHLGDKKRAEEWARENLSLVPGHRSTGSSHRGRNAGSNAAQGADIGTSRVGNTRRALNG